MKKYLLKLFVTTIIIISLAGFSIITPLSTPTITSEAHSGRTDSSGGHKDNKNKSGLGSYHYHCGGHKAHLHKNGKCPTKTKGTRLLRW